MVDENYVVHIGDKVNDSFTVSIKIEKIGTSYVTVKANASSTKGAIIEYIFVVDGVEKTSIDQSTFTEENLEEKSTHKIKVIAVDEKENKKTSREITITTEPRTYLYQAGNEYTELTGGWQAVAKMNETDQGYPTTMPTLTIDSNINAYVSQHSSSFWGGAVTTKNKINMSNYKLYKYLSFLEMYLVFFTINNKSDIIRKNNGRL